MFRITSQACRFRFYCIQHATKKKVKYTDSINLPKTKFPNRLVAAKRHEVEQQLLEKAIASSYGYQELHNKEPAFVLHDGPPYANGDLHLGHAVNKILKDITIRQHVTNGRKIHFKPGWDCHGLPIELKAMSSIYDGSTPVDSLDIRRKCRTFALATVERQKQEFRSWGILADWYNNRESSQMYLTLQPDFVVNQLQMFQNLYDKRLIYRDLKPVFWSPSSRTALAEAELEYDSNFISPSVYIRFALEKWPSGLDVCSNSQLYALVWTTTPWTLPSNQAICYNAQLEYSLVRLSGELKSTSDDLYLIASPLLADFKSVTGLTCQVVTTVHGANLSACTYRHPLMKGQTALPFISAMHVQDTKGTGLVHTAPAHGPEDFLVSLDHHLPVKCFVNESGNYTKEAPKFLQGKNVITDGNELVMKYLDHEIVFRGKLMHSHPIDWRTKEPVIIRASEQWFINTDRLKDRAIEEINRIEIYPRVNADASRRSMISQIRKRPYWCISRQRAWGVPIPVFYQKSSSKVLANRELLDHICQLVQSEGGIDFWWSKSIEELIPHELLSKNHLQNHHDLAKGSDIFDIWFDSGSTWATALSGNKVADLYLEGYDQFTGWFQSSLLTSLAARNCSPYRSLFVHGFTVDENGHKMSKSLGNVISPQDITKKYGTDTLRWWVATHGTQNMSITASDRLLQQSAESLARIRSTLRYLNGSIGTKDSDIHKRPATHLANSYLNKYLLSTLVDYEVQIQNHYAHYEYNRVVVDIQNFIANQLSAVFIHLIKDRMYCGTDRQLQDIRFVLAKCYETLCKSLWPITPFLIEESWSYYAKEPFHQHLIDVDPLWKQPEVEDAINMAMEVKRSMNQRITDTNTWTVAVTVDCLANSSQLSLLQQLQPISYGNVATSDTELCELLQVHSVCLRAVDQLEEMGNNFAIVIHPLDLKLCPRCRRFEASTESENEPCARCKEVLKAKCISLKI